MRGKMLLGSAVALIAVLVAVTSTTAAQAQQGPAAQHRGLVALRHATDKFHSIAVVEQRGYGLLLDKDGIACIDMPGMGGMGVHWANSKRVGNPTIVAKHPEAMVYAPGPNGTLRLAAVEYVVIKDAWRANHTGRPHLFGHKFNFTPAGNRFGLPAYYSLHVWVWKHNPAGMFSMWNPDVTCPS